VKSLQNRKEEKEKEEKEENKKTFVKSFGGWTSGPLDKCFLLKDKKEERR